VAIPVIADADTLFGATTRGFLINLDYQGLIHLHWSPLILEEMSRALVTTGRKADDAAAQANEALMRRALPAAEVPTTDVQAQFQAVAFGMRSAKDTHIAACAHAVLAQQYYPGLQVVSLMTNNVRDFGVTKLATVGIAVQRPDPFLLALFQQQPDEVGAAFQALRQSLRSNPTVQRLLDRLGGDGQVQVAAAMLAAWQRGSVVL
jgi:hypothetical protein